MDENGKTRKKLYRLFGESIQKEKARGPVDAEREVDDYNLLIIVVEDVDHSEEIYLDAVNTFAGIQIELFKYGIILLTVFLIAFYVIFSLGVIKMEVINPITQLTNVMLKPKGVEHIEKYVEKIQLRNIRQQDKIFRKQYKQLNRLRLKKMKQKD